MSDRAPNQISIGGTLDQGQVQGLLEAVSKARLSLDWGGDAFEPDLATDLLNAVIEQKTGHLTLVDDQAPLDGFPDLEDKLVALKIAYDRHTDAKFESSAMLVCYRPDMSTPVEFLSNQEGAALVPYASIAEVRRVLRDGGANSTNEALKVLDDVLGAEFGDLPNLSVKPQ